MAAGTPVAFRYQVKQCALLRQAVWAIRVRQPDGGWRIVNCLDKHGACLMFRCAFTTAQGQWPYPSTPPIPPLR
jgi:hypothetical protein